jgi:methionyl aminopeptidase
VGGLVLKSPAELEIMNQSCRIVLEILDQLAELIEPGMTTMDIDKISEDRIREIGAKPAFKGYPHPGGGNDFPGTACTSVNSEVVHGIPATHVILKDGDIVSVDMGVLYKGYYGDSARTYPVGRISDEAQSLLKVTKESLEQGIEQVRLGNRVSDIGHAVQAHVEKHGFSVVREFVGHGIGSNLHEEPQVPNFGAPGRRERLEEGLVLAIEPMVNMGSPEVAHSGDGWTTRTRDNSLSAHFELCVAVTADGPRVLGGAGVLAG